jgi:hypothetical protein
MARAGVVMYGRTALLLRARVEGRKGVQSVTERCVATHGQCGSGGRRCRDAAAQGKTKRRKNMMRRGLCAAFDAVQSTAAKHPITIPEISTKRPKTQLFEMNHTRLPHSEGDEALRTATVQVFITVIRCSNYDSRPLALGRRVGRQHTPSCFEKDNTNPVEMHHANEFTPGGSSDRCFTVI